jgi:hypothetical protein
MATKKPAQVPHPLAQALDDTEPLKMSGNQLKVDYYFGDHPEVLASIISARKRGLSYETIAEKLSDPDNGIVIGAEAVKRWLKARVTQ